VLHPLLYKLLKLSFSVKYRKYKNVIRFLIFSIFWYFRKCTIYSNPGIYTGCCRARYKIKSRRTGGWTRRLVDDTQNKCLKVFHICIRRISSIET